MEDVLGSYLFAEYVAGTFAPLPEVAKWCRGGIDSGR